MNQFIAGTIAGMSGILVGQPLDTVKVRLQTSKGLYRGPLHCGMQIAKREGLRGFFKGVVSPLAANAPINAILFYVHFHSVSYLEEGPGANLSTLALQFFGGCVSGLSQVLIACPAELIKIQLQVNEGVAAVHYNSTWDCARSIVRADGVKGLFRGLGFTIARDVPAFGLYFSSYWWFKDYFCRRREERYSQVFAAAIDGDLPPLDSQPAYGRYHEHDVMDWDGSISKSLDVFARSTPPPMLHPSLPELMFSGGMAGLCSFIFLHPIDVLKSLRQSIKPGSDVTLTQVMAESYKREGYKYLFRGIVPTLVRAFPASAVVFVVEEEIVKLLSR